jgi:hypothetical protein
MTKWTKDDLLKLDAKYAAEGVHLHQRPLRAAMEILGPEFVLGLGGNPEVKKITDAYAELIPEVNSSWPGAGIGLAVSVDRVRKLTFPVVFGTRSLEPWQCGFNSREEWVAWCRNDRDIAAEASFAFADLHDFTHGLNALERDNVDAITLWRMARSNLEDLANNLPSTFSVDTIIQPVCLVAELALKAALVWTGVDPNSFKGPKGHDLAGSGQSSYEERHRQPAALRRQPLQAGWPDAASGRASCARCPVRCCVNDTADHRCRYRCTNGSGRLAGAAEAARYVKLTACEGETCSPQNKRAG